MADASPATPGPAPGSHIQSASFSMKQQLGNIRSDDDDVDNDDRHDDNDVYYHNFHIQKFPSIQRVLNQDSPLDAIFAENSFSSNNAQ